MLLHIQFLGVICTALQFPYVCSHTFPEPVRRYSTDAILWEFDEPHSRIIRYTQTKKEDWMDLNAFIVGKSRWAKAAKLCFHGIGGWLLYPKPNFSIGNPSYIRLAVVYNPEAQPLCIVPTDIESLQPIGDTRYRPYGSYAFERRYFRSPPILVDAKNGLVHKDIRSFITTGDRITWTVTDDDENDASACLKPDLHSSVICLYPNLDATLGWSKNSGKPGNLRSFKPNPNSGCTATRPKFQLEPQSCYVPGLHKIFINQVMTITSVGELCQGEETSVKKTTQQMLNSMLEVWGARQEERLNSLLFRKIYDRYETKMSIIQGVGTVFEYLCPADLVPRQYIHILRRVFEMHVRIAHHIDTELLAPINTTEWIPVRKTLRDCENRLLSIKPQYEPKPAPSSRGIPQAWNPMMVKKKNYCESSDPNDNIFNAKKANVYPQMDEGKNYDPVFEQMWLVLNGASSTCSHLVDNYQTNFWADLVELFRRYYLVPLQQQWLNPGKWLMLYPILFAGFDMEVMRRNIVRCVDRSFGPESAPYSPVSRVQMFERYRESGYPREVKDATLRPHLQQRSDSNNDESQLKDDNRFIRLDFPTKK